MPNYPCMTLNQKLLPGDTVTSPLGLYVLTFTSNALSLTVTFTGTTPNQTVTLSSWSSAAPYVKLATNGLVADTNPPVVIASASPPVLGLDVQDNGQVVIYSAGGTAEWIWTFSPPPGPLLATVHGAIRVLEAKVDALHKEVASLHPSDGAEKRGSRPVGPFSESGTGTRALAGHKEKATG